MTVKQQWDIREDTFILDIFGIVTSCPLANYSMLMKKRKGKNIEISWIYNFTGIV